MTATQEFESTRENAPDIWPPDSARPRWDRLRERITPEGVISFLVVALSAVLVFRALQPSQVFKNTTPAGGDMGAHVWLPAYVKRALLPHLRITGWTPDWYNGFPALTYYFPLPIVGIALLSYVLPYDIAFKLVSILGLVTLPIAAYAFGRLARMRFPMPAIMAAATLPFIFSREFTIYGGNIASTMAGEFSFSISLSFALLFLGLVARGLQDGKHRASAAVVLACCGLSHILPLFFAIAGALVMIAMHIVTSRDWKPLQWGIPALVTGGLLFSFWALPFWWRLPYATNMGYGKITSIWGTLSHKDGILIALALVGFILSCARFNRVGVWLGLMAFVAAIAFWIAPPARLWNARVLPFWFLCLYLLVGVLIYEVGSLIVEMARPKGSNETPSYYAIPVLAMLGIGIFVYYPLGYLPGEHQTSAGQNDWLGITTSSSSFVKDWVYWNYSGYENGGKSRKNEYFALVDEMKTIGQKYGCGQAEWQYEGELNDMGTPDALMLLPYWTKGCVGSEEGLYYESSASTPYHFIDNSELSECPSNPVRGLTYSTGLDVTEGVQHMQIMGDKYFMAETPPVEQAADANSNLRLVGTVGPFPVNYSDKNCTAYSSDGVLQRTWKIYEVLGAGTSPSPDVVEPLANQPVVMTGIESRNPQVWLDASQAWFNDPSRWNVYEAANGPKNWARVSPGATNAPVTPEPVITVSNVKKGTQSISFDVSQTGVPVLVKESYFPNWQVKGASGVYRVTPNLMLVVPTSNHVSLTYGTTPVDWIGLILSILGLGAVGYFWKAAPVAYSGRPTRRRRLSFRVALVDDPIGEGPGQIEPAGANGKVAGLMAAPEASPLDRVFKAYDIRGTVPDQMNVTLARAVGQAFAAFVKATPVVVGRDMRPSGPDLVRAFADGVTEAGVDVVDIGLCSTDEMYFASGSMNAPGAMFTASHNPAQYNGIKLCRAGAAPVGADTGLQEIRAAVETALTGAAGGPSPRPAGWSRMGTVTKVDVLSDYADKVRSFVDLSVLRPLKVVADTANGMGGLVVPAVFSSLPFELEVLFPELDGTFPNHPADPIQPENLRALQARIRETGADVGLAFDGDADRCFLVDDQGVPVSGSTTTALVAASMLDKTPGATILHNLICSKAVPEIVTELGGVPVRTRVGHSYIKAVMAQTNALFGGEHSGHYYFRDNYRADSGAIAALIVLETLSLVGQPLSEVRRRFERYADSGEINTEVSDPAVVIEKIAAAYRSYPQDRLDGLTVDAGDWWFNVRPSNTEPLLRLNLEAPDRASCEEHTAEVLSLFSTDSQRSPG
jgi:phosphomannomutase